METSKLFKAISDSNRLRILNILSVRDLCVCEITHVLKLATSTVSKHLAILRDAKLISDSKDGKWINYSLRHNQLSQKTIELIMKIQNENELDRNLIKKDSALVETIDRNLICANDRQR